MRPVVLFSIVFGRFFVALVSTAAVLALSGCAPGEGSTDGDTYDSLTKAYQNRVSDVQVRGEGVVNRILSDDNQGSRHQRFIVRLGSGHTVLIQHNIDLAPRIADIKEGDAVSFFGEYIWNEQGGLIHWTHHDPAARHVGGWVKHNDTTYE
jgi:hypothetical protein